MRIEEEYPHLLQTLMIYGAIGRATLNVQTLTRLFMGPWKNRSERFCLSMERKRQEISTCHNTIKHNFMTIVNLDTT
jgi:hypothetical protein